MCLNTREIIPQYSFCTVFDIIAGNGDKKEFIKYRTYAIEKVTSLLPKTAVLPLLRENENQLSKF